MAATAFHAATTSAPPQPDPDRAGQSNVCNSTQQGPFVVMSVNVLKCKGNDFQQ